MGQDTAKDGLEGIVGYAYPTPEPTEDGRSFRRRWVVRCRNVLLSGERLRSLSVMLEERVEQVLRDTYSPHACEEQIAGSKPVVRIVPIEPQYCVVSITSPAPSRAVGDAAAIGTWMVLRGMDEALSIEDLQGLPRRMWFQLL